MAPSITIPYITWSSKPKKVYKKELINVIIDQQKEIKALRKEIKKLKSK